MRGNAGSIATGEGAYPSPRIASPVGTGRDLSGVRFCSSLRHQFRPRREGMRNPFSPLTHRLSPGRPRSRSGKMRTSPRIHLIYSGFWRGALFHESESRSKTTGRKSEVKMDSGFRRNDGGGQSRVRKGFFNPPLTPRSPANHALKSLRRRNPAVRPLRWRA